MLRECERSSSLEPSVGCSASGIAERSSAQGGVAAIAIIIMRPGKQSLPSYHVAWVERWKTSFLKVWAKDGKREVKNIQPLPGLLVSRGVSAELLAGRSCLLWA